MRAGDFLLWCDKEIPEHPESVDSVEQEGLDGLLLLVLALFKFLGMLNSANFLCGKRKVEQRILKIWKLGQSMKICKDFGV